MSNIIHKPSDKKYPNGYKTFLAVRLCYLMNWDRGHNWNLISNPLSTKALEQIVLKLESLTKEK